MNLGASLRRTWVKVAALVSGLALCWMAFDWRDCVVAHNAFDKTTFFVPLDAKPFFYGSEFANSVIGNLTPRGRYWYGGSEVTLDLAFPILYAIAFLWILGRIFPKNHKFRTAALVLPVIAAASDVLENILIAVMAFWPASIKVLGGFAGILGLAKWVLVCLSGLVVLVAFVVVRRSTAARLVQYLYFTRVPLLFGILLLFLSHFGRQQSCDHPAAEIVGMPTVQNLLTLNNGVKIAYASLSLFLSCAVIIFCGTHIWRLARDRFSLEGSLGLAAETVDTPGTRRLFALSAFALSLPILWRLPGEIGWTKATVWATIGIGVGIGVLHLVCAVRQNLGREELNGVTRLLAQPLRAANTRKTREAVVSFSREWLGPGFVNDETGGTIYRGHGLALVVFIALAIGYVIGYSLLNPSRPMYSILDVPPIGYVMLLFAFVCSALTFLTFIFDRFRVPVLVLIAAWLTFWGLFPFQFYDAQYYFDIDFLAGDSNKPPTIAEAFNARVDALSSDVGLVTVVAVTGGGIQAAGWGAQVLSGLHERLGKDFTDSIFLISSTSGGSVATYYFLEALREDHGYLPRVPEAAMASSLEATAWGLVFPDLQRVLVPFTIWKGSGRTRLDRAWATEQAWLRWRNCMFAQIPDDITEFEQNPNCRGRVGATTRTRLSDWAQSARAGKFPGVIFNATIIEDGEQFLASNLDLGTMKLAGNHAQTFAFDGNWTYGNFDPTLSAHYPATEPANVASQTVSLGPYFRRTRFIDMDMVTAARLSAAFPYVTPVARAKVRNEDVPAWHVADGGYFDNSGSVAAVRWLNAVRDTLRSHTDTKAARILFIQINPFPARERETVNEGQGWISSLIGPLQGIINVRTSSQLARNDLELAFLEQELGECFEAIEFRPVSDAKRRDPPLSWELSQADKAQILKDWDGNTNRAEYIERNYFGSNKNAASRKCEDYLTKKEIAESVLQPVQ